ncbi:dienelactone hydrolase family protein [Candidatus Synechococcus calcipolaris G9]|uniref:Dienelactone hydrolase family protein n=1 Tax=Candidatus Synechococcus calcipolaris G9 TaxID=1497997 RepID=A0ABT6F3D5_9SYNE|nr:dienelactone hydrolase family protein [Candidatus Synechococcus calcipolaris]MDG2992367.1 dienelactone hydrolase family protein [Candidatus Synechococcus calcipolaris G9]
MVDIETRWVQIVNGDLLIDAYLALPKEGGPYPGIIVFQEIFGVNHHIRDVSERLAQEGYVVLAPALYQRLAPGFETDYGPADIDLGRQYKDQTTADELISDTQAAIAYLRGLGQVINAEIGTIGFCFGGHVAYLAATLPEIKATASFYGAGIATMTPGGGLPTVSRTSEIRGSLYAFFGDQDASIPLEHIQTIESELHKHGVRHHIFLYPADHGFFCDQRQSYDPAAAKDAWEQVKTLFQSVLKAP